MLVSVDVPSGWFGVRYAPMNSVLLAGSAAGAEIAVLTPLTVRFAVFWPGP